MELTETATRRRVPAIAARAMLDPKLTQGALGQLLGVSTSLVARIELGERTPSPDLAERWARALGLPPEHVFPDLVPPKDGDA